MPYGHLTISDREDISNMRYAGKSQEEIARALGRAPSTIGRELRRNGTGQRYSAQAAQRKAQARRRARPLRRKLDDPELNAAVRRGLAQEWSPEQIVGRLRIEHRERPKKRISHATIYRWLASDGEDRAHFRSFLRERGRRRKRRNIRETRGHIADRRSIDERPAEVAARDRFGDWEGDTMEGSRKSSYFVTHVERRSGYLLAARMNDKRATTLNRATRRIFDGLPPELRRTLTVDNGKEFARHAALARHLGVAIYFAHPYCSWERGSNENANGLLRQYFPKGTDFRDVSHHELAWVTRKLNNRPRKRLGYRTPAEVLFDT